MRYTIEEVIANMQTMRVKCNSYKGCSLPA